MAQSILLKLNDAAEAAAFQKIAGGAIKNAAPGWESRSVI